MRRSIKKACALVLACAMTFQPVNGYFGSRQVNAVEVAEWGQKCHTQDMIQQ